MFCTREVTGDLIWVGVNDRRLAMFESVYPVPAGVSYNAYLLLDDKTVLFDTVDKAVRKRFLENTAAALHGRPLDYLVVQHMEPDHSAALEDILVRFPNVTIVCNEKTLAFIRQFTGYDEFGAGAGEGVLIVKEGDVLDTGRHKLHFFMAPMVHWPEVMVTYDATDRILFSADAFGTFGALNGALFADEVDFYKDYMDEARRYYANIVGKYGVQVQSLLNKTSALQIDMICPLHGFVWRRNLSGFISKYELWSTYKPEEKGVLIAYATVYGGTENAADILACRLRNAGIKTVMYDVSFTPASEIVAAAFKWSHLVFASTTYNAGIFVSMAALLDDLTAHNIQNRKVAIIENGSWAPTSGNLIREKLSASKNMNILENSLSIRSSLKASQLPELDALASAIADGFNLPVAGAAPDGGPAPAVDPMVMFKLSYGLFVLTARDGNKDNGCITNTVIQITEKPLRICLAVNKSNYTHDMIAATRAFNISILSQNAPFAIFKQFGFQSGRDTDKFDGCGYGDRAANGIRYVPEYVNGVISAKVSSAFDYGSHTLFVADVTQTFALSREPSVTYQYYFDNIKPKPRPPAENKKGYVCRICGYIHEGDELPEDIICPICKHGAADFEKIK